MSGPCHNLTAAFLLLLPSILFAGDIPPNPATDRASGISLTAGRDITLLPGEHVPLTFFDSKANKPIQVSKISWTIDGQSPEQAPATLGVLTVPDDNPFGTNTVYTAPAQIPSKPSIELIATVSTSDQPVVLTTKINIVSDPNSFTVGGDTGFGTRTVPVQIGGPFPSRAGLEGWLIKYAAKSDPKSRVDFTVDFGADAKGRAGTYPWLGADRSLGATVGVGDKGFMSLDLSASNFRGKLDGSATILEPDPTDTSGPVKGFFRGNLYWPEIIQGPGQRYLGSKDHYVTVRGHFAVPKSGK